MSAPGRIDCVHNENAVCPHCGYHDGDTWEYFLEDGDTLNVECDECGKSFVIECSVEITYTTVIYE